MSQLGPEVRVGIFTILGLAATVFAVFVINPDTFNKDDKVGYFTILKDASGILPKTHVKTNGVNVGKVTGVSLDKNATPLKGQFPVEERLNPFGVKFMSFRMNPFRQGFFVVGLFDGNNRLPDDRTGVDPLIDEVQGATGDLGAVVQRLTDRMKPGKGGKERGMNIHESPLVMPDESGGQEAHKTGQGDQINVRFLKEGF